MASGRALRVLSVIDACTRECLALEVAKVGAGASMPRSELEPGDNLSIKSLEQSEEELRHLEHSAMANRLILQFLRRSVAIECLHEIVI
jgi:hypothetical protein